MIHIDQYRFGVAGGSPGTQCWEFNNGVIDEKISISKPSPDIFNFQYTDPFSISVWLKYTSAGRMRIISKLSAASTAGYVLESNAGKLKLLLQQSGSIVIIGATNGTYNDGAWHHIVATNDGSKNIAMITDGIDDSAATVEVGTVTTISNAQGIAFGGFTLSGIQVYVGKMVDPSIFDTQLSVANANDMYNGGVPRNEDATANNLAYFVCSDSSDGANGIIDRINAGSNDGSYVNMNNATNLITDYPP